MTGKKNGEATRRILLIGYGNPGRLDDGLGPALAAEVEKLGIPGLDVDSDYQLTVEHASDVAAYDAVIFADADVSGREPFSFGEIEPAAGAPGLSSHAIEAADVLAMAWKMFGARTRGFALGIRGYRFNEFGEELSEKARTNLTAAVDFVDTIIRKGLTAQEKTGRINLGAAMTKSKKHLILCVDDDRDFLDSLKMIIESGGYRMETANSAQEGLKKYQEVRPSMVIVDLMMEEIDSGINFVKELRALGSTPPIYMLSSVGDNLNANIDFSQLGLTGVLQKPINPDKLMATLKAQLK